MLNIADLKAWESRHGMIPNDAVVILRSGLGQYYGKNKTAYLGWPAGVEESNPSDTDHMHFPGFDPEAAQWLGDYRKVCLTNL